jgi:hypothetical protein
MCERMHSMLFTDRNFSSVLPSAGAVTFVVYVESFILYFSFYYHSDGKLFITRFVISHVPLTALVTQLLP